MNLFLCRQNLREELHRLSVDLLRKRCLIVMTAPDSSVCPYYSRRMRRNGVMVVIQDLNTSECLQRNIKLTSIYFTYKSFELHLKNDAAEQFIVSLFWNISNTRKESLDCFLVDLSAIILC